MPTGDRQDFGRQLGEDLWALVRATGAPLVAAIPLGNISACPAFRLEFGDGQILKGRRLPTETQAIRTEYILRCADHAAFPKVLARHGTALLTSWVDGTPLDRIVLTADLARGCGALQLLLHRVALPRDNPYAAQTARHNAASLQAGFDQLTTAGFLDAEETGALLDLALRHMPVSCETGFVHSDFCAENIIVRAAGDLCVIDSDALTVDALDYDLGRTWYRWPMPAPLRAAFLAGYASGRSTDDFVTHFPYWAVAATLAGALYRLRQHPQAIPAPVNRLRDLLLHARRGVTTGTALLETCG